MLLDDKRFFNTVVCQGGSYKEPQTKCFMDQLRTFPFNRITALGTPIRDIELMGDRKSEYMSVRGEIARRHLRLGFKRAYALQESNKMEFSDCIQFTYIGLLYAVDRYDFNKPGAFSTYAMLWIRQAVSREIYKNGLIRIPEYLKGEGPKTECVSDLTLEEQEQIFGSQTIDFLDIIHNQDAVERLRSVVSNLPPRERLIALHSFSLFGNQFMSVHELGVVLDISHQRVSQIRHVALYRIKARMSLFMRGMESAVAEPLPKKDKPGMELPFLTDKQPQPKNLTRAVGKVMGDIRRAKGLTREKLANWAMLSQAYILTMEEGRCNYLQVEKLLCVCKALRVSIGKVMEQAEKDALR